ncbi:plasma-membrane proton-e [Basidiobolus meristosporus CBS 931.73]|uniref:Plasma membrane ATPase n=1 Tax=Basidiobolus meristosporus CBS 931.73 TaxID=1314790 RepID=A0A1Y1Y4K5_9FUNG|nr:plasma-membrane proton-e [Basidiobolus meristosporus CBS 931.73]|eukprot:ORX92534.1 plasma-membrane proton-e [Basidiobolus meristosporus CBS 931.73]
MSVEEEKNKVELEDHKHQEMAEEIPPELEALLHTDPAKGLTSAEVAQRLEQFGRNELSEKKKNPFLKFLGYFTGAIAYLIEIAWILSGVVQDWANFGIIGALLFINAAIGFIEESKAENALDALKNTLALKTRVWRDGELNEIDVVDLVPGDVIVLRLGDIVPADCRLLGIGVHGEPVEGNLQIDQSALTGESLPVSKGKGATAYSSSIVKQGQQMGVVTKTGEHTFIGRAATLMSNTNEQGHFQKIINRIGNFLVLVTILLVVIIFIVLMVKDKGHNVLDILRQVLVLTVAAIPVGLPTVMSVTMAVGAKQLAKKEVIVKRLTAVEEMASVSVLCSDKTGTLTLNELTFDEPWLCKGYTSDDILMYSYMAAEQGANDPIEYAVRTAARAQLDTLQSLGEKETKIPGFKTTSFLPFNPVTKLTQATILNEETGEVFKVAKGAPQVIIKLVGGNDDAIHAVNSLARRGLRALGVARTINGDIEQWELIGMISLLDPPRPDSAATIARCHEMGVSVKMITGDQLIIAKEVAQRLGMQRAILEAQKLVEADVPEEEIVRRCVKADGFAQVVPEHKYRVVELLQEQGLLVGMTGDGVNDAPALKKANVGIAVHGCTDAARSASDIVLLAPGLSTIVDGITTSRAIFQRMRSYALYRITSTIHFLLFFFFVTIIFQWQLDAILLIFIAVLNDAATLVISVDNAQISAKPDKWRIGQLITMSFTLAVFLTGASFAHFFIARDVFNVTNDELGTIMYLHISSCPHFVIFSTRLSGFFWENLPSWTFTIAILGTQVFAMLISVFGVPGLTTAIGWGWGCSVIAISLGYFVVLDFVKVFMFRIWSFELTAKLWPTPTRRRKLSARKIEKELNTRVTSNIEKVRTAVRAIHAINLLQNGNTSEKTTH